MANIGFYIIYWIIYEDYPIVETGWSGYVNTWDDPHTTTSYGSNYVFCGVSSYHDDGKEDRRYRFEYCYPSPIQSLDSTTSWSGYTGWDATWTYECSNLYFISGWSSYHDDGKEDRRFRFTCSRYSGADVGSCVWSGYVNDWDATFNYECTNGYGLVGITSYHSDSKEDRRFNFKCCQISIPIPTPSPTSQPTKKPTSNPSKYPTKRPTRTPSKTPTKTPTKYPTTVPTNQPSLIPTITPTNHPSTPPTHYPSMTPVNYPTVNPTKRPTDMPTQTPSNNPSITPTMTPSGNPSNIPTFTPSQIPSITPTKSPSKFPSVNPSTNPSKAPSVSPTKNPSFILKFKSNDEATSNLLFYFIIGSALFCLCCAMLAGYFFMKNKKQKKFMNDQLRIANNNDNKHTEMTNLSTNNVVTMDQLLKVIQYLQSQQNGDNINDNDIDIDPTILNLIEMQKKQYQNKGLTNTNDIPFNSNSNSNNVNLNGEKDIQENMQEVDFYRVYSNSGPLTPTTSIVPMNSLSINEEGNNNNNTTGLRDNDIEINDTIMNKGLPPIPKVDNEFDENFLFPDPVQNVVNINMNGVTPDIVPFDGDSSNDSDVIEGGTTQG